MNNKRVKKAFSMMELVFVIVILGILASVAIPKLMGTREDAYIAKGKNQIASIKNGINMIASKNLLGGGCSSGSRYPDDLNASDYVATYDSSNGKELFGGVLKEPIISSNSDGGWVQTNARNYRYYIQYNTKYADFEYHSTKDTSVTPNILAGTFKCNTTTSNPTSLCTTLTK